MGLSMRNETFNLLTKLLGRDAASWERRAFILLRVLQCLVVVVLVETTLFRYQPILSDIVKSLLIYGIILISCASFYAHMRFMAAAKKYLGENIHWSAMWTMPLPSPKNMHRFEAWLDSKRQAS